MRASVHYYHRLIAEDFLPQVIGVQRTIELARDGRRFYFPDGFYDNVNAEIEQPWMPVEFSVAAYRFAHSQVRFEYDLNSAMQDVPLFDPASGGLMGFKPIAVDKMIDWRYFFPVTDSDSSVMQRARKIDPRLPRHLFELHKVDVVPADDVGSLAARNLNRGRVYRLPAGQDLAKAMGEDYIKADVHTLNVLAIPKTPLWYYILQEANHVYSAWNSTANLIEEVPLIDLADASAHAAVTKQYESGVGFRGVQYIQRKGRSAATSIGGDNSGSGGATSGVVSKPIGGNILGPVGGTIVGEVLYGLLDHYHERTGKGLDFNATIEIGFIETKSYGRRVQIQHLLGFAGQL